MQINRIPNSGAKHPEYIDGIDLLKGCGPLKSGANVATKTIWLWPGWLNNCSTVFMKDGRMLNTDNIGPNVLKSLNLTNFHF